VDKIAVKAKKNEQGLVTSVEVTLRTTEEIQASSLTNGVRLAAVDAGGQVVRTALNVPAVPDRFTAKWTLTAEEWSALVDSAPVTVNGNPTTAQALSVAATASLRATAWNANLPIMAAPTWATSGKSVYTSGSLPVEVRESLSNLSQWLTAIPANEEKTTTIYEVPSLLALGAPRVLNANGRSSTGEPERLILTAGFHAHPFQDPATGLDYVRARWFDVQNGAWLTPDPAGYRDSANLYSYAGGDPVNGRDSDGMMTLRQALADGNLTVDELAQVDLTEAEVQAIIDSIPKQQDTGFWATNIIPKDPKTDPVGARRQAKYILLFRMKAFRQYVGQLYEMTRGLNPVQFAAEAGWAIGSGYEPVMGNKIDRTDKVIELVTYLAFIKGSDWVAGKLAKIRATAIGAEEPKPVVPMQKRLTPHEKELLGKMWSREAILARGGTIIGEETDLIFTSGGRRVGVRADYVVREADGTISYIEVKFSPSAPYQPNQKIVYPELIKAGDQGMVAEVGARTGGGAFVRGQRVRVRFQGDIWDGAGKLAGH
jgi:RHS repeat-associated protein